MKRAWWTGIWRQSRRQGTSAVCALGLLSFGVASCMPVRNTARRPMAAGIRASSQPIVQRLMVATLRSDTVRPGAKARSGWGGASRSRYRDASLSEFTTAVRRSGLARTVIASPVNDVPNREVLLAAKSAGATHMVTTRVLSFRVRRGYNAHFAWSVTLGLILFPLLPLFYYLVPQNTLEVSATLEVALWNVADRRRVWNRHVRGDAAATSAQTTLHRNLERVGRIALSEAYGRALPVLLRGLRDWIKPLPTTPSTGARSGPGAPLK